MILPFLFLSCRNQEAEAKILQLQNELDKSQIVITNYEAQIDQLKSDLDKMNFDLEFERVSENYSDTEFLVFDGQSYIPKGFAITEGYLRIIRGDDIGVSNEDISDGLIFYITDEDSTVNEYLSNIIGKKIFFHQDESGNMGLTVHVDPAIQEKLLQSSSESPSKVILTLQDVFPMNGPAFFPFATVHLANDTQSAE